jgi:hypothetical protein
MYVPTNVALRESEEKTNEKSLKHRLGVDVKNIFYNQNIGPNFLKIFAEKFSKKWRF